MIKRLRMFAGPNGSGKSTLIDVLDKRHLGIYINPDEIEKNIKLNNGCFDFRNFNINLNQNRFERYVKSAFYKIDLNDITLNQNSICFKKINSYIASILSSFIREELLLQGKSFTFETVMSSKDKVSFLQKAQEVGFKTYLYFIATDDPQINISRVKNRVANGGHDVPESKIVSRYYKTLDNLIEAVKYTNRAFLFDNSLEERSFICEIENAKKVDIKVDKVPNWFNKYFLEKLKAK